MTQTEVTTHQKPGRKSVQFTCAAGNVDHCYSCTGYPILDTATTTCVAVTNCTGGTANIKFVDGDFVCSADTGAYTFTDTNSVAFTAASCAPFTNIETTILAWVTDGSKNC